MLGISVFPFFFFHFLRLFIYIYILKKNNTNIETFTTIYSILFYATNKTLQILLLTYLLLYEYYRHIKVQKLYFFVIDVP